MCIFLNYNEPLALVWYLYSFLSIYILSKFQPQLRCTNMVYMLFVNGPEFLLNAKGVECKTRPKRPPCEPTPYPNTENTCSSECQASQILRPDLLQNPIPRNRLRRSLPHLPLRLRA
jgi:hypothetical protein